jgi:cobalt-zinc-cadmium efflux system protein
MSNGQTKTNNVQLAFFLNLSFALVEIAGGLWTNSMAILSDALHDLGDTFSLGLAWILERYSAKESDHKYSYGYKRFSLLGAFVNIIILLGGSLYILSEAVPRLLHPQSAHVPGMILFAVIGIAVNGFAMLRLRHSQKMNARIVALHMLEDMLGWMAVLIISIVLLFSDFFILDPLLSIIITSIILINVVRNLKKTTALFLQASPDEVGIKEIESQLLSIDQIESVHHTHAWSLDGEHHVLTTHIVVCKETPQNEILKIKQRVRQLASENGFVHITIETETSGEACSMSS